VLLISHTPKALLDKGLNGKKNHVRICVYCAQKRGAVVGSQEDEFVRVRIVGNGILELPRQIVRHFGFVAGDEVEVFLDGDRVVVYPVRSEIEGGTGDREREGLLDAESRRRDLERRLRREFDES